MTYLLVAILIIVLLNLGLTLATKAPLKHQIKERLRKEFKEFVSNWDKEESPHILPDRPTYTLTYYDQLGTDKIYKVESKITEIDKKAVSDPTGITVTADQPPLPLYGRMSYEEHVREMEAQGHRM